MLPLSPYSITIKVSKNISQIFPPKCCVVWTGLANITQICIKRLTHICKYSGALQNICHSPLALLSPGLSIKINMFAL